MKHSGADSSLRADSARGAIMGLMIGDALGMPLEFSERDQFTVSGLTAGGVFNLDAGYWTDDSSMGHSGGGFWSAGGGFFMVKLIFHLTGLRMFIRCGLRITLPRICCLCNIAIMV